MVGGSLGLFARYKKAFFWAFLWAAAGVVIYLLVSRVADVALPFFIWSRLRHISDTLALQSGLSPNLMLCVVIIATIPLFWAVWKYTGGIFKLRHLRPSLRLYSNGYGIIIVCYVAAFFLAQFLASRHAYYSQWCAETPEGIKSFDTHGTGHDPTYGIQLHPCTFAEIVELRRKQVSVVAPREIQIRDPENFAFFDPVTAAPRVWFYRTDDGHYRLYDGPGSDSATGTALSPIDAKTRDALINIERQVQQRGAQVAAAESEARHASFIDRFLNVGAAGPVGANRTAVLIFETSGRELSEADDYVLSRVSQYRAVPVYSLFKPAFVSEGRAAALLNGDWSEARQIDLAYHVMYVILGTARVSYTQNQALEGVQTANLDLHLKALNVATQSVVEDATIQVAGAGFSETAALNNAIVHAHPQLDSFAESALGNK